MNGALSWSPEKGLILRADHWRAMVDHIERHLPEEACGLVGGRDGLTELVLPVTNLLHSPVRFRMDPQEQFNGFSRLEEKNLELLAIFHSHPTGPHEPSATDLAEFAYPDVVCLICYPDAAGWQVRAFLILIEEEKQTRRAKEIGVRVQ